MRLSVSGGTSASGDVGILPDLHGTLVHVSGVGSSAVHANAAASGIALDAQTLIAIDEAMGDVVVR
jgi:hypothetical protein